MGVHARGAAGRARRRATATVAAALIAAAAVVALIAHPTLGGTAVPGTGVTIAGGVQLPSRSSAPPAGSAGSSVPPSTAPAPPAVSATPPAAAPTTPATAADAAARARLTALVAQLPPGSVSVVAHNTVTGARFGFGDREGMVTASTAKLLILEALLLQRGGPDALTADEHDAATAMITDSDNDAAETLFEAAGGTAGVAAVQARLGAATTTTQLGPDGEWGLTTTNAGDQVHLLANLVAAGSPLTAASRAYVLGLMSSVQPDQAWGVSAVADPGTVPALKNGWLSVDDDDELWAIDSDGIVTVGGQQILISVLTQHNDSEADGIALVEQLAEAAVAAVR